MTKRPRARWTTAKTGYLLSNADDMPLDELAERLGCTPEAVKQHAKRIRRTGQHVTLHRRPAGMRMCPACGKLRSRHGSGGVCRCCELEAQLERIKARQAALMPLLPQSDRARYARTEAQLESAPLPKPKPPRITGMMPAEKRRAVEEQERALEAWEIGCLVRRVKAAQKRKERMEKKCRGEDYDTLPGQRREGGSDE